uniref:ERF family protein n=1 Tax=Pectinatus frisingensis TaxID=865 RepID=UPI0018C5A134
MQKLAKKLIEIMKDCAYITKNGINNFHNYKYTTSADVLEKVNTAMVKQGICSIAVPEIISINEITTAKGNTEKLATVKVNITLIDRDSDESITITGLGSGQDAGDKAVMKAQTAAIKYAYMLSFAIATGDDPEADSKTDENT